MAQFFAWWQYHFNYFWYTNFCGRIVYPMFKQYNEDDINRLCMRSAEDEIFRSFNYW
eukprot:403354522